MRGKAVAKIAQFNQNKGKTNVDAPTRTHGGKQIRNKKVVV